MLIHCQHLSIRRRLRSEFRHTRSRPYHTISRTTSHHSMIRSCRIIRCISRKRKRRLALQLLLALGVAPGPVAILQQEDVAGGVVPVQAVGGVREQAVDPPVAVAGTIRWDVVWCDMVRFTSLLCRAILTSPLMPYCCVTLLPAVIDTSSTCNWRAGASRETPTSTRVLSIVAFALAVSDEDSTRHVLSIYC